jgi:secreted PhoX family phosphatase
MSTRFLDLSDPARRHVLRGSGALAFAAALPRAWGADTAKHLGNLGFKPVPASTADTLQVPEGYRATVLAPWGEPVGLPGRMPAWRDDASQGAAEQAAQMGMHHDGLQFLPLGPGGQRGLLVVNHEYVDDGLLHTDGTEPWTAEKVLKSQAAHGLSAIEVAQHNGRWQHVRPSPYARRVTAQTPMALHGPAAGHRLMRTAADPSGRRVLGTFNNCALSLTPWGTVLSGEENFDNYFVSQADPPDPHQERWGIGRRSWSRWHEFDERFDATRHPHEPNRFGWIVELDPQDPSSVPIKRTALGRACHEGGWVGLTRAQRAVVYATEDAAFEYLYKFVSQGRMAPGGAAANRELLDHGTLYVAQFEPGGRGRWLPMVQGQGPLTAAQGFADTAEVLIKARQASDALGATRMDRPEWVAVDATSRWVYCSLTNNRERGRPGKPGPDAANPRAENHMGHIIRWREDGDLDGLAFEWEHFVLCGDPQQGQPHWQGNVRGDPFACPDSLAFGPGQVLWTCTDMGSGSTERDSTRAFGHNAVLACDPATGHFSRFMTGPANAEFTGVCFAPDGKTLFVSVQHPGESPRGRNQPQQPDRYSRWPDQRPGARPRSAIVAVQRDDGGVIGLA